MWSWGWSWSLWNAAPLRNCRRVGPACQSDKGSGAVHACVKSCLFITQDLVKRATAAGRLGSPVDQCGRQYANLIVEISQDLLAVGMTDGNGANTRADHPQGRLVQVGRQYVLGLVSA